MTVEFSGIPYESIDDVVKELAEAGLTTGGTGARVRPVTACKGTTCVFGFYDTQALGQKVHDRFYEGMGSVRLPHKFKIAVGGCPNNCVKPGLNDFGVYGQSVPEQDLDKCRSCAKCGVIERCPVHCVSRGPAGKIVVDKEKCTNCGKCIKACPMGLQPLQLYRYVNAGMKDELERFNLEDCMECGCCSYVCPGRLPLVETFKAGKKLLKEGKRK